LEIQRLSGLNVKQDKEIIMKGFIIGLIILATLILGGWQVEAGLAEKPSESYQEFQSEPVQAGRLEEITGRWHAFPVGLLVQFNEDGSAQFGLDWDGTSMGDEAIIWFEGQALSVQFTDYEGQDEACASAIGRYTVQLYQGESISFTAVHDDCQFRMDILSGRGEEELGLMYHSVQFEAMDEGLVESEL
jgi:hypothetical protein